MYPEIVSFGPFAVRGYGLMLAIGFLTGIMLAAYRAKKQGENPDHVYNLSIWIVASALIGARLYFIITHYSEFRAPANASFLSRIVIELKNMFWPVGADGVIGIGGLILYGGLIGATITTVIYLRVHRLKIARFLDILGPSLGLGEFFTRIGCFLNGCCYGMPTKNPLGIVFPDESAAGFHYPGLHIHPSQLYNSFAGLSIFLLLLGLERWKRFDGYTALWYFMLYAVARFSIDFSRYYEEEMRVFGLSQNQILSLIVFIAAGSAMTVLSLRARGNTLTR